MAEQYFPLLGRLSTGAIVETELGQPSYSVFAKVLAKGLGFARY
jgi:hypothetical protein